MTQTRYLRHLAASAVAGAALCGAGCPSPQTVSSSPNRKTPATFENVTTAAGIHYRWEIPGKRPTNLLQTIGTGCAFLDFDGDGNLDILLVGTKPALYKGDGKGHFTDASALLNGITGYFLGCAVGDVNNDGYPDIHLSGYREGRLLKNNSGKGFTDVTAASGLKPQPWGSSCAFVETTPGSGRLDLVIANYADFGPGAKELCDLRDKDGKLIQTSCGPRDYQPLPGVFYRNNGDFHFNDATVAAGFDKLRGRGLGLAACDVGGVGRPEIYIANDEIGGDLLRWKGSKYENVAEVSGTAYDRAGNVHGGMGTAWGDYDNDGRPDLVVATFFSEPKSVYHNEGDGQFTDVAYPVGVGTPTLPYVAFGVGLFDFDNDGWLDIAFSNGHVQDNITLIDPKNSYHQPSQLFHNLGRTGTAPVRFEDVTAANPALQKPILGRGLAVGDFDNDGRVDILIVDSEGEPLLLHNQGTGTNHWLGLSLVGTKSNRDGYGAMVTVEAGRKKYLRHCHSDGSYLSASDKRVHFGLGAETVAAKITIRWPSGAVQTLTDVKADQYVTVKEAAKTP